MKTEAINEKMQKNQGVHFQNYSSQMPGISICTLLGILWQGVRILE